MRYIGTLPTAQLAERLADYLVSQNQPCRVDTTPAGFDLWIVEEEHVASARATFEHFLAQPDDPRYAAARGVAQQRRRDEDRQNREYRKNVVDYRTRMTRSRPGPAKVSVALAVVCCVLYFLTNDHGETANQIFEHLMISMHSIRPIPRTWPFGLIEVAHGEIWRLVTPALLHGSIPHLVFNMLALVQLGSLFEMLFGKGRYLALLLLSAVFSNLVQYFWAGPNFVGMSGVVYAIFGFLWSYSRTAPRAPFRLEQRSIFLMLLWLGLCMIGDMNIANGAHVGGLVFGFAAGWVAAKSQ